jgi:hypothetical protein
MFKFFGFSKMHGYFLYDINGKEIIKYIETPAYLQFQKINKDFGLSFIILIYALSRIFITKLPIDYILKLLIERKDQVNDILNCIDKYLNENFNYFFLDVNKSTSKINNLMLQITNELIQGDFIVVMRPNYSLKYKERIVVEFIEQMCLYDKKNDINIFMSLRNDIKQMLPKYKEKGNADLKNLGIKSIKLSQ